jgi:sortase A
VLLTKKRRWPRYSKRRIYKRRRRTGLFFLVFLTVLALAALDIYLSSNVFEGTSGEPLERVVTPTVEQAPEPIAEQKAAKEENKRAAPVVPNDPTLYLTVPRLGIYGHTVRNDDSEFALGLGAVKLPGTDFPWQKGDTNTYIACHRLGFPGTESYNQCLNLPFIQQGDEMTLADANGTVYRYRVTEMLVVGPDDGWITKPVLGRQVVSLQTCVEAPGDFSTLGPNWAARFIARADRIS